MNVISFGKTNVHTTDIILVYLSISHAALIMVLYSNPVQISSLKVNIVQMPKPHQVFQNSVN